MSYAPNCAFCSAFEALVGADFLFAAKSFCLRLEKRGAYHAAAALRTAGRPPLLQQLTALEQGAPFARQVLPQLRAGDPVVIRMLGADGRSFSCASERCPAYLLRADGTIEPIE